MSSVRIIIVIGLIENDSKDVSYNSPLLPDVQLLKWLPIVKITKNVFNSVIVTFCEQTHCAFIGGYCLSFLNIKKWQLWEFEQLNTLQSSVEISLNISPFNQNIFFTIMCNKIIDKIR